MCKCEIIPTTLTTKVGPLITCVPLVLRTRKIAQNNYNKDSVWGVFCSQTCYTEFFYKYWRQVIAIAPRLEALETPIEVTTETREDWRGQPYQTKVINKIDNNSNP